MVLLQVDTGENIYPQFNRALVAIVFRNRTNAFRRDISPEFTGNFPLCDLPVPNETAATMALCMDDIDTP